MHFRSLLFVPGDRFDRFDKAAAAGADVVVLDLEDGVLPEARVRARTAVRAWLEAGGRAAIRVNGSGTEWHRDDVALLHAPGVVAAVLPKAEDPRTLAEFGAALPAGVAIVPLVESAIGIWNVRELATVPKVSQLAFGSVDFQLDCGIEGDGDALLHARSRLVLASAAARIAPPVDGVTVALGDRQRLLSDIASARALGFGGKLCIHPSQVADVNTGFLPDAGALAFARAVVEAAEANGDGAFRLQGRLVDRPVVEQARRLLAAASRQP